MKGLCSPVDVPFSEMKGWRLVFSMIPTDRNTTQESWSNETSELMVWFTSSCFLPQAAAARHGAKAPAFL